MCMVEAHLLCSNTLSEFWRQRFTQKYNIKQTEKQATHNKSIEMTRRTLQEKDRNPENSRKLPSQSTTCY